MASDFDLSEIRHNFKRAADVAAGNGVRQRILWDTNDRRTVEPRQNGYNTQKQLQKLFQAGSFAYLLAREKYANATETKQLYR